VAQAIVEIGKAQAAVDDFTNAQNRLKAVLGNLTAILAMVTAH
jgi:hypothetical protein